MKFIIRNSIWRKFYNSRVYNIVYKNSPRNVSEKYSSLKSYKF